MNFPVALVVVSVICVQVGAKWSNPNCGIVVRCSFEEDIIWATDGKKCYPFVNPCHYRNNICYRRERKLPGLKVVSRSRCQALCARACTRIWDPVCGIYKGVKKQFPNPCEMEAHICTTGEFYQLYKYGPC